MMEPEPGQDWLLSAGRSFSSGRKAEPLSAGPTWDSGYHKSAVTPHSTPSKLLPGHSGVPTLLGMSPGLCPALQLRENFPWDLDDAPAKSPELRFCSTPIGSAGWFRDAQIPR